MSGQNRQDLRTYQEAIRKQILDLVNSMPQPVKQIDLFVTLAQTRLEAGQDMDLTALQQEMFRLVRDKEVVEVNYTLASSNYRERTLYFPKDTVLRMGV